MDKISAVYKILNTVTGEFYIGSSKDVKHRWANHKCPSVWKAKPNKRLYQDMEKYGVYKFRFQILAPVMEEYLTQVEQEFIELLKPTYNNNNAKGLDVERAKANRRKVAMKYYYSDKGKEYMRKYNQSEKGKEAHKKYQQSEKGKEVRKKYYNRPCLYNGETLTLGALIKRFRRAGISHPVLEAKKYLIYK